MPGGEEDAVFAAASALTEHGNSSLKKMSGAPSNIFRTGAAK